MDIQYDYEAIVIGSGFGGSINTCRLSKNGQAKCYYWKEVKDTLWALLPAHLTIWRATSGTCRKKNVICQKNCKVKKATAYLISVILIIWMR